MEEEIKSKDEKMLKTIISLKLHNIMSENGIEAITTTINRNDPTKIVWKYEPSAKFFELLNNYVKESQEKKKNN